MDPRKLDDAVRRTQDGDVEAYEAVVLGYQRRLRGLAAAWAPPGVDPDEVAHMAFVEAFKQIDRYRPGSNMFAWLSAFVRNLLLAECKRLQRRQRRDAGYLDHLAADRMTARLEASSDDEAPLRALERCLGRLDEASRGLVSSYYTEGKPLRVIAESLSRTEGAIKTHLYAIRKALRACMGVGAGGA